MVNGTIHGTATDRAEQFEQERTMRYPKIMAGVMTAALTLSLGLVGCGGSGGETKTEEKTETTEVVEETTNKKDDADAKADTKTDTKASKKATKTPPVTEEQLDEIAEIPNAWMGMNEEGETFYYAESEDYGCMVILNPDTSEYFAFAGPTTLVGDNQVQIEDEETGVTLTFEVTAADEDGNLVINMGDQLGEAVLAACDIDEVLEAFDVIAENGTQLDLNDLVAALNGEEATDDAEDSFYVGAWAWALLVDDDGNTMTPDEFAEANDAEAGSLDVTYEFKANGTVVAEMLGVEVEGTWEETEDGVALTVEDQTSEMVYEEIDGEDALTSYDENSGLTSVFVKQ